MYYEIGGAIVILLLVLLSIQQTSGDLVVCETRHTRLFPVRHSFKYPLLYAFFPIDRPPRGLLINVQSQDYLGSPPCGSQLQDKLKWHLDRHGIPTKAMTAMMLTMPRFFGYSFNPLTVYYVYDPELVAVVLEVHNTFGEKHIYVTKGSQSIPRRFHVSPFNDRLGTYEFKVTPPMSIELTLVTPEGRPKLVASLKGKKTAKMSSPAVVLLCLQCGWWIFMTFPRILYEAWRLHYQKKLPVYMRPEPLDDTGTVQRQSPTSVDRYFKRFMIEYFRWRGDSITFRNVANNLDPEIIEIGPSKTITVLSDSYFTNLNVDPEYISGLSWWRRYEYYYMRSRVRMAAWIQEELFQRIATFAK